MSYNTTVVVHLDYTIDSPIDLEALRDHVAAKLNHTNLDAKSIFAECVDVFVGTPI